MSQERLLVSEVLVQISPEEREQFGRINDEVFATFNSIIALFDSLKEEDKNDFFDYLEKANILAGEFKLLFDEVSGENFSPQSSVVAMIMTAEKMQEQLQKIKRDFEEEMQTRSYKISSSTGESEITAESSAEKPSEAEVAPDNAPLAAEAVSETEVLTTRYKMADPTAFLIEDAQGQSKRKPFRVIRTELKDVFTAQKYGQYGERFLNEIVDAAGKKISALNTQKKAEKNFRAREEMNRHINSIYQDLQQDISAFMQTAKVDMEEDLSEEVAQLEEQQQDIEGDITAATEAFREINEHLAEDSAVRHNPEYLATAQAIVALDEYHEEDTVRAATDRERMNKVLQKSLNKLRAVLEQVPTTEITKAAENVVAVLPDDVEEIVDEPVLTEAETETPVNEVVAPVEEFAEGVSDTTGSEGGVDIMEPKAEGVSPAAATATVAENTYEIDYHKKRSEWRAVREDFRTKETEYQAAMAEYFQADNWKARVRSGVFNSKKLLGLNPELPPALQAMRVEYQTMRAVYAKSLDEALMSRSQSNLEYNEYRTDSDTTKAAFASKFILRPTEKILSLQERSMLSQERQEQLTRVMQTMSKYKWLTRAGMITAAGVVGGLSGSLALAAAGASWQASKIALSAGAGAGAAHVTRKGLQGRVDIANSALTSAEAKAKDSFSLRTLSTLDDSFAGALATKKLADRQQKTATIVAAAVAGGAVGFASGQFGQEGVAIAHSEVVEGDIELKPETSVQTETELTPDSVPFEIQEIKVPLNNFEGRLTYDTILSDVSFGTASHTEIMSATEQANLTDFIKLKASDLLSAHPNMSEARLESELFKSVQGNFGGASWWNDAKISQIDIGKFELQPHSTVAAAVESVSSTAAEVPTTYVIEKGDTLADVVEEKFAADLKGLTPTERTAVLDTLFEKIQNNPELKTELGLRSNDVDLIYAGEKLNLAVLDGELDKVLERQEIIEQFTRSAPMTVAPDAGVQDVPITVVEKPIPDGVKIAVGDIAYTEATPTANAATAAAEAPLTPPRPLALGGQYSEQPEYREYITKVFGNGKAFEQAVERAVSTFDNKTYDIFDRSTFFGGGMYESPYRLLSEMSLKEVAEFEAQPNDQIRYFLSQNNIKYDTYLAWLDKIDEMTKTLPNKPSTTVADLFARQVTETQIPRTIVTK